MKEGFNPVQNEEQSLDAFRVPQQILVGKPDLLAGSNQLKLAGIGYLIGAWLGRKRSTQSLRNMNYLSSDENIHRRTFLTGLAGAYLGRGLGSFIDEKRHKK